MFSIVIPLYNKAHTVERTLQTVLLQTYKEFEIILVNDGSTDETISKIKSFSADNRIKIFEQENKGVSSARNYGVTCASFRYIAFLDGDDEWMPNYLETLFNSIVDYPNSELFCTAGYVTGNQGRVLRLASKYKNKILPINFFENPHVFLHISATVVTKDLFEKIGGFIIGMKANEDFAFIFSAALFTEVIYCGYPLSIYNGDIIGQTTSSLSREIVYDCIAKRLSFCRQKWLDSGKNNKLFLIFERYEIRHIVLTILKEKKFYLLKNFLFNIDIAIEDFSSKEVFLWKSKKYKYVTITWLYFTKIIWRLHGFPTVSK